MAWYEHGKSRIYFEEEGGGDPLLLLPGWGGTIDDFGQLRRALASGYTVVAADLPGSGKSGPQPREYTASYYQDDATSLLALVDEVGKGPAHLLGYSDGGEYALLMAELGAGAVRSLVTWGAGGRIEMTTDVLDAFASLVDSPIPEFKEYSDYMKATYGEGNARIMARTVAKAWGAIADRGGDISRLRAGEIACPALLIVGSEDFIAPPALVADMAAAIPNCEFVEVKDAGHAVHRDRPEWLGKTVVEWLADR
jgi:valacyclovir hydrolase